MSKIIAFSGSNSSTSINKQLIHYISTIKENVEVIDLKDFEPPIYSPDLEKEVGSHQKIKDLVSKFSEADGVIISTPEHNSMPPAFFKNILDWLSRTGATYLDGTKYLQDKKVIVMSSSPGGSGAKGAQALVQKMVGYAGAEVVGNYTLPSFYDNFIDGQLVNEELKNELKDVLSKI